MLLEYFNIRAYSSLQYKDKLIYYYTDPEQPGMIYWTYSAPAKVPLPVPVTKSAWEEAVDMLKKAGAAAQSAVKVIGEVIQKTGKVIEAIGMLSIAVALLADDAAGIVADDVLAVGLFLEAFVLFKQAFSDSCDA